ncbi:unnamed protein product [Spirodela intermedia]|uniref:Uncharacterized protein n=1 Tax=Spirodela intermedia TaxID=51605 RepID=A0A7I8I7V4_SPIIN|nr:unnamed protein product [Spirodela intermedia]CAA6653473.1 unnamed protein product [Spirodela intermedia]
MYLPEPSGEKPGGRGRSPLPLTHLHAVRKNPPEKPWRKPAGPGASPRVYRVHPGASASCQRGAAPPQPPPAWPDGPAWGGAHGVDVSVRVAPCPPREAAPPSAAGGDPASNSTGIPSASDYSSYLAWCSLPTLSPRSTTCME